MANPVPAHAAPRPMRGQAKLLHELQVHQAELEMQNEELRRTQVDLATARDRFVDLYDFAPVGYFTIDDDGFIVEANLTAARMLGVERKDLLRQRFAQHVAPACADQWHHHLRHALAQDDAQRIELLLQRRAGEPLQGQLDCLRMGGEGAPPKLRIALTDVSDRALAQRNRRIADSAMQTQESQRYRVAHELHEELGQRLVALKMDLAGWLQAARSAQGSDDAQQRASADTMLQTLDEAVGTVRRISSELAPLMLRDLGLQAAVEWLVRDTERRSGRRIELSVQEGDAPLGERTAVALYRMAQDMLEPLLHGADLDAIRFDLHQRHDEYLLSIEAGGGAWPEQVHAGPGVATALHDRAHLLGARVEVQATRGGRARLTVRLPLSRAKTPGEGGRRSAPA